MTLPDWTPSEALFGILVLSGFATFVVTLAGGHLYTILASRAPAKAQGGAIRRSRRLRLTRVVDQHAAFVPALSQGLADARRPGALS